jgi:hypothetical protein
MFKKSIKPQFEYAGHGIGLIYETDGTEWTLQVFSMSNRDGYDKDDAELEAWNSIVNIVMFDKDLEVENLKSLEVSVQKAIAQNIAYGTFQAVN